MKKEDEAFGMTRQETLQKVSQFFDGTFSGVAVFVILAVSDGDNGLYIRMPSCLSQKNKLLLLELTRQLVENQSRD
jgi:DNA-binding cell septation regulator SpoVG